MLKIFQLLFLFFFFFKISSAQQVAVGKWRDHLPYSHGLKVAAAGNKIYCITSSGIFTFDKNDNSIERISKINGLSDVGTTAIAYSQTYGMVVIGYSNGNVDIIDGSTIYNIQDIKNKIMTGSKYINDIMTDDRYAYLSCGFGIVVIDLTRKEIKDTYLIGTNGDFTNILDVTKDNQYIYAATEKGILRGSSTGNLVDFAEWTNITDIAPGQPFAWMKNKKFDRIESFNNKLYANYASGHYSKDSIVCFDGNSWSPFMNSGSYTRDIKASNNHLIIVEDYNLIVYKSDMSLLWRIWDLGLGTKSFRAAIFDQAESFWIADNTLGLVRMLSVWTYENMYPKGPEKSNVFKMSAVNGNLWVASGAINGSWGNTYASGEVYSFINETWNSLTSVQYPVITEKGVQDIIEVEVNPNNPSQVFAGSWNGGVVEYNNGALTTVYNESNSSLESINSDEYLIKIGGLAIDNSGNLWVANSHAEHPFSVKLANGTWHRFPYKSYVSNILVGDIVVTRNNHKWAILPRASGGGLFAFDEKETYTNFSDDKIKKISVSDQNGTVISNDVYSIAEDHDGQIWVGTNKGIVVYYNPENVFTGTNFYAQQIKVPNEIEGQANYLLETEMVTAIAVDGANRKWLGTQNAGVFLMSPDGITQIYNFNTDNSPLLSNNIMSIAIDGSSGEVFFGTANGIISYRSTATEGAAEFSEVLVFPNPVKPGYEGLITIKGLITNANVKITDITGNLVFETKAEGGQAIWNGKNLSGEKVHTGVYLVFSTNEDGSKSNVTKLMFIN
ncbi:MAG: hypothetical protein A2275_06685 [Bacteroidetes bacterium RIFOXYA12_FULL_35_11]|nr:MAG: hypothetical protein A2X01_14550 [Bacteroidetes bacterium GWF2_35_48]OFY76759.1 MAG: hypothetical protein A2275_06685 [Bacteroidetes bacterium RIFOXYA12_FULL_35_11]OFY92649.1 MAG: hypothetical protein A2491_05380 [Bacteroidetes bacterium RIFOXYC12_FULL_35_7]OFY95549.1 MAG: hypothetical protein A2309_04970 [Bacteroidetes bacterium RIFOXYB2_FULL_35_7]HBX50024.1 hypothetical protein [Bacteroidales bacterium]